MMNNVYRKFHGHYCHTLLLQVGILCVRGCEIEGMLDEEGKVIEDGKETVGI